MINGEYVSNGKLAAQLDLGRGDSIPRVKIGTVCHGGFPLTVLTHFAIV